MLRKNHFFSAYGSTRVRSVQLLLAEGAQYPAHSPGRCSWEGLTGPPTPYLPGFTASGVRCYTGAVFFNTAGGRAGICMAPV